eukprot:TRINITY_DN59902_c0_g2_i2.p1 TRINITY_DN59902_c0_g2~~TRINITY_DN59902_c0_g2_i2.p1  ORF type:complete len:330 (-),score=14.92 TRINITY_DN59902_c0_g2_i2:9-998(-)
MRCIAVALLALLLWRCSAYDVDDDNPVSSTMCATYSQTGEIDPFFPYEMENGEVRIDTSAHESFSSTPVEFDSAVSWFEQYHLATGSLRIRWTGHLESRCSAFAVGPHTIMTAMHCIKPGGVYHFTTDIRGHSRHKGLQWHLATPHKPWIDAHDSKTRIPKQSAENDADPNTGKPTKLPCDVAYLNVIDLTFENFFTLGLLYEQPGFPQFVDETGNEIEDGLLAVVCANSVPQKEQQAGCANRPGYPDIHMLVDLFTFKVKVVAPAKLEKCSLKLCNVRWTGFAGCSGGVLVSLSEPWKAYGVVTTENYNFVTMFTHPTFQELTTQCPW